MKYSIHIPESWEKMTSSKQGKFCQVCEKEVIDFTKTTDAELLEKIKSGQKICGRFKQSQLSRDLKPNNNKTNWKQLAVAAGFTSILAMAAPANAQTTSAKTEQLEKTSEKNSEEKHPISAKDSIVISGKIYCQHKEPVRGAIIALSNHKYGVIADNDGNFELSISEKDRKENLNIIITFLGFEKKEIAIPKKSKVINVQLTEINESNLMMGEVIVTAKNKNN